jgi:hypothetical protein
MIEYCALKFCEAYGKLWRQIDAVFIRQRDDRTKELNDRKLSDGYTRFVADEGLALLMAEMDRLELDKELRHKTKLLYARMADPGSRNWTAELLLDSLTEIRRGIGLELNKHKFAYVRSPNNQYLEQEHLFGSEVHSKFKSARQDIKEAGNCFAMELYTAAVFHLMRVSEHGLRMIAKRVGATIIAKGTRIPIEYGDWQKVIDAINARIATIRTLPHGPKRQARLSFYSDAAQHCLFMKDIYRNDISHTRKPYDQHEATGAMQRVHDFMQFLTRSFPK